jgi:hypothetical protein
MWKGPGELMHTWDDSIKMYTKETGYEDLDWISLAADRKIQCRALQNIVISLWVP